MFNYFKKIYLAINTTFTIIVINNVFIINILFDLKKRVIKVFLISNNVIFKKSKI